MREIELRAWIGTPPPYMSMEEAVEFVRKYDCIIDNNDDGPAVSVITTGKIDPKKAERCREEVKAAIHTDEMARKVYLIVAAETLKGKPIEYC